MGKDTKKIGVRITFAWIFSVLFYLSGLGFLRTSILSAILMIVAGTLIFPPFNIWLKKEHKLEITTWLKIIIVFVLLMSAGISIPSEETNNINQEKLNDVIKRTNAYRIWNLQYPGEEMSFSPMNESIIQRAIELTPNLAPKRII